VITRMTRLQLVAYLTVVVCLTAVAFALAGPGMLAGLALGIVLGVVV
jgi:hypothetical protein